jgi:hypothetical protein
VSALANENAALHAANQQLRGNNARLRCQVDHLKAIVGQDRQPVLPHERLVVIAGTNRWSDDFAGCVE